MLIDGVRGMSGSCDSVRLPLHAAWVSRGRCSSCMAFATVKTSIGARLTDTVALPAPSDWGNTGFSGESRAE